VSCTCAFDIVSSKGRFLVVSLNTAIAQPMLRSATCPGGRGPARVSLRRYSLPRRNFWLPKGRARGKPCDLRTSGMNCAVVRHIPASRDSKKLLSWRHLLRGIKLEPDST
jgi:hypothetical protein